MRIAAYDTSTFLNYPPEYLDEIFNGFDKVVIVDIVWQELKELKDSNKKIPEIRQQVKKLMKTFNKYAEKIQSAVSKTVKFEYPENIDLLHFLKNFKPLVEGDSSVTTAIAKVETAAKAAIINSKTTGRVASKNRYKNCEGIAIYLPQRFTYESLYSDLGFSKNGMWDDMILTLTLRSQRDVKETIDGACKGDFKGFCKGLA